jgi:hypothetical protein
MNRIGVDLGGTKAVEVKRPSFSITNAGGYCLV